MSRSILVVEDDVDIAHLVHLHLRDLGCEVDLAHDGLSGVTQALSKSYDLIILDLMLPRRDGVRVCQQLRAQPNYTPVLMLTAKSSELDRVLGFEVGADDYITKPFSIRELQARVKALFRLVESLRTPVVSIRSKMFHAGDLVLDVEKRKVALQGEPIDLTAKEFDLLQQFIQHPGRVFTRTELLNSVWGYGHDGYEHTVNSHINRLRAKIEKDHTRPEYVLTVWGVGYKFYESGKGDA
ncbi:MAG: response regulator transcription factor [Nitrospirales bacterium]|nr:response regulator transcription factor [Nitrospirales bacterium]